MPTLVQTPAATGWQSYAYASGIDHFAWWCAEHCVQSIDQFAGLPLVLEDWQCDFMAEALAVEDDEGTPYWSSAGLILPRKNGKSTMLSAFGAYQLVEDEGQPEILLTASSDEQAGRMFDYGVSFIRQSPYLLDQLHLREYKGEIARKDGGGKMKRMASEPGAAHGANPSLVIVDELHAFTKPSLRKFWAAITTAGGARKKTRVFFITTAGEAHEREESILGRLIDGNESQGEIEQRGALTISRNHAARVLIYNYSAETKDRTDVAAVKRANPASWVTEEYLGRQAANPELTDAEFLQLHACVWADSADTFIPADVWDALPAAQITDEAYIGIDGSYTYDTTCVAWATRDGEYVDVDARIFSARHDAPHHELCAGGKINFGRVEAFTSERIRELHVREAAFDPRYLGRSAELIEESTGVVIFPVEPQSVHMRDALATFHRLVTDGKLRHTHDDAIRAHVLAAQADRDDRGWRVSKRKNSRPIDAIPAMAMAVWRAMRIESSPYESREMLVL